MYLCTILFFWLCEYPSSFQLSNSSRQGYRGSSVNLGFNLVLSKSSPTPRTVEISELFRCFVVEFGLMNQSRMQTHAMLSTEVDEQS